MRKLILFLLLLAAFAFTSYGEKPVKVSNSAKNWENYSNDELMKSIKSDANKMSTKMKILSDRYYAKAKDAANSGKEDVAETYKSCANSLKEIAHGLDKNKADLLAKGKDTYLKAKAKIKEIGCKLVNNTAPETKPVTK